VSKTYSVGRRPSASPNRLRRFKRFGQSYRSPVSVWYGADWTISSKPPPELAPCDSYLALASSPLPRTIFPFGPRRRMIKRPSLVNSMPAWSGGAIEGWLQTSQRPTIADRSPGSSNRWTDTKGLVQVAAQNEDVVAATASSAVWPASNSRCAAGVDARRGSPRGSASSPSVEPRVS
jgi:hypothetical protein